MREWSQLEEKEQIEITDIIARARRTGSVVASNYYELMHIRQMHGIEDGDAAYPPHVIYFSVLMARDIECPHPEHFRNEVEKTDDMPASAFECRACKKIVVPTEGDPWSR